MRYLFPYLYDFLGFDLKERNRGAQEQTEYQ